LPQQQDVKPHGASLDATELAAWRGFLRAHARLIRELSAELERTHGLPLSSYEVLLHLANAPDERMRMAELADSVLLSPSGITRLVDRLVLGGFSQGCVMSYALGLAEGRTAPRALFALSGFMPVVEDLELDLDRPGLELVIEHGAQDPVIGASFAREARARLAGSPISVRYREFAGAHWVDPATLPTLQAAVDAALA